MTYELIAAVFGGGVVVAIIEGIREALAHRRSRRDTLEDREQEDLEGRINGMEGYIDELKAMVSALVDSNKFLIYERIRYLGQVYISKGEIDFDERRILHAMHDTYHNGLNGNGDLDALMKQIDELPLKQS